MYPKKKAKLARYVKSTLSSLLMLGLGLVGGYQVHRHMSPPPSVYVQEGNIQARFSPKGGCTAMLIQAWGKAKNNLELAIFDLTSKEIANALIKLHQNGLYIRIVADRRQSKGRYSKLPLLHQSGIPIRIAKCSGLMHHKVSIIDNGEGGLLTGSFNYSFGAENKNIENLLWIKIKTCARTYQKEWQSLWSKSKPYTL